VDRDESRNSGCSYLQTDDTIQKQVFYIPTGNSEEKLIYDFNLGVGDTLFSYLNWNEPLIVDYLDSVLINDEYHKRILFQYDEAEIIEGIGSRTGIVEELVAFEGGSYLCALYVDTLLIYPDYPCNLSATDTCLTLGIIQAKNNISDIEMSPNPAKLYCQINISNEVLLQQPKLEIITPLGIKCQTHFLTNNNTRIYLGNLKAGIYICNFYANNILITSEKLVKE